jgi:hypothetical protein
MRWLCLHCHHSIRKYHPITMRPVFAIAPLALAMALWGPASQARSSGTSWTAAFIEWAFARHTLTTLPEKAASSPSFSLPFERQGERR